MERTICPVCKGSKKCPECNGKGYKMKKVSILATSPWKLELTASAYEIKRMPCYICQGDGLCPECHGTGFLDDPKQEIFEQIHKKFEQYVDKGNYDEAEKLLNESLANHGREPDLLYDLGQLLAIKGRKHRQNGNKQEALLEFEKAIHIFEEIIQIDPGYKEAYLNICVIFHLDMGEYEKAVKIAEKGLKLFPKYYALAVFLCMSLNKLAQWEKVFEIATTKLEEVENDTDPELDYEIEDERGEVKGTVRDEAKGAFLVCLGDASFGEGEFVKATDFYERAMRIPYWNTEFVDEKLKKCKEKERG